MLCFFFMYKNKFSCIFFFTCNTIKTTNGILIILIMFLQFGGAYIIMLYLNEHMIQTIWNISVFYMYFLGMSYLLLVFFQKYSYSNIVWSCLYTCIPVWNNYYNNHHHHHHIHILYYPAYIILLWLCFNLFYALVFYLFRCRLERIHIWLLTPYIIGPSNNLLFLWIVMGSWYN